MSSVAAGAGRAWFSKEEGRTGYTFHHNGVQPTKENVESLFSALLGGQEELRYLALAINSFLKESDEVVMCSAGYRYRFTADGIEMEETSTNSFSLHCPDAVEGGTSNKLTSRAVYAPLVLTREEWPLNNPDKLPVSDVAAVLQVHNSTVKGDHFVVMRGFGTGRKWTEGDEGALTQLADGSEVAHCLAVILLLDNDSKSSELWLLRHGVVVTRREFPHRTGAVILAGSEGLQMDLSSLQVVGNRAYDNLVSWLIRKCDDLDRHLTKAYPFLSRKERLRAARTRY